MRRLGLLSFLFLAGLGGCGTNHSSTPPTPIPPKTYHDSTFNFSFRYPGNWSIAGKGGRVTTVGNVQTYIVTVNIPGSSANLEVTIDGQVIPFPPFQDGHTSPSQDGSPNTLQYFHDQVSGLPAMRVERIHQNQVDEIDTLVNNRRKSYDVRMVTGTPPFSTTVRNGYSVVTRSLTLPFS
ncbi:MAG: hypothetical protein NVSMB52_03120 [Chloroflexota bacterium]